MIKLYFEIGGYRGENIRIFKHYNSIVVQTSDRPYYDDIDKISHKLTKDQWDSFWSNLDQIDIWNWKKDYFNQDVLDGTQWELIIKRDNKKTIKIYGSNAYPENFQLFLDVINSVAKTKITYDKDI